MGDHYEFSVDFYDTLKLIIATSDKVEYFAGVPVYVNKYMPPSTGLMLDSNGNVVKIFKLEK